MRFKEFAGYEWFSFIVDSFAVHILFSASEAGPIHEGKSKSFELGGAYSAQLHQAHTSVGQTHIHVYAKNNQLFAMNQDGSAHDRSHGSQIPNKVAQAITQEFPDFTLPPDNFIEGASAEILFAFGRQLLRG
ncbi:MAG: hypothetical protein ACYDEV_03710 [Acidiferrobacter sp.]